MLYVPPGASSEQTAHNINALATWMIEHPCEPVIEPVPSDVPITAALEAAAMPQIALDDETRQPARSSFVARDRYCQDPFSLLPSSMLSSIPNWCIFLSDSFSNSYQLIFLTNSYLSIFLDPPNTCVREHSQFS